MIETTTARCCVVGGGPAGMMLGLLLARAGVDVLVLEKHADFLRDFRGDTIHPSTLEIVHELGALDEFLALPHEKTYQLRARFGDVATPWRTSAICPRAVASSSSCPSDAFRPRSAGWPPTPPAGWARSRGGRRPPVHQAASRSTRSWHLRQVVTSGIAASRSAPIGSLHTSHTP